MTYSARQQAQAWKSLQECARDVSNQLTTLREDVDQRQQTLQAEFEQAIAAETHESGQRIRQLEDRLLEQLEAARLHYEQQVEQAHADRNVTSDDVAQHRASAIEEANFTYSTTSANLTSDFQKDKEEAVRQHKQYNASCIARSGQLDEAIAAAAELLHKRNVSFEIRKLDPPAMLEASSTYLTEFQERYDEFSSQVHAYRRLVVNRFLDEGWTVLLLLLAVTAMAYPVGRFFDFAPIPWAATTLLGPLLVVGVVHFVFKSLATNAAREWQHSFSLTAGKASGAIRSASQSGKREFESTLERLATQHQQNQRRALEEKEEQVAAAEQAFRRRRQRLEALFRRRLQELETDWEKHCQVAKSQINPQMELAKQQLEQSKADRTSLYQQQSRELEDRLQQDTKRLHQTWQTANDDFQKMLVEKQEVARRNEGSLAEILNDAWNWPTQPPVAVPFAKVALPAMTLDVDSAASESKQLVLPAMLSYPEHGSLLIDTGRDGQQAASQLMRHVMLRILANFPPGKVRFTIIDPVGLGQVFSALMHLADYDELLVHSRIWTDSSHIAQRLADLTQHMENVIQKYLRNEFESIQQYNEHAGEVAEPFQILVIANFPTSFSDEAQRRLASICASGAKCGVYTLISYAGNDALPKNFSPNSLEEHANVLCWDSATSSFRWKEESLHSFPVDVGPSPDEQTVTEFLKRVGQRALRDNRVEVAFEKVAPPLNQIWRESSANELTVALGRAGATKLQTLSLGHGTSQHVLISGKTGSGKSTLLHALITNLALHYSPAEVQFYLIDFKKGVEFKPYADLHLPHARVIAIESEREFGMSVLENLDQELRRRGDLFRQAGVQSLAAFREANSAEPMPRLLLIVDEFQEFFVNDDRISHDASLLLDRIVRQGRAFGMHVVLGSQTLAGAYSLARSTIGQMGIRIALQCSEADSHLILSEDNNAARLLNRPGEAIYNDSSGTVEGNSLFQVVWLTDQQRQSYVQQLSERASTEFVHLPSPIVFEGNAAADLDANPQLLGADQEEAERTVAWLGDPVAIKEPTHIQFGRQHGTNLLLSGQSPELAMGIMSAAMLSLMEPASTDANSIARFVVLDGLRADAGETLFGDRLAQYFPGQIQVVGPNGADKVLLELADELKRRQDDSETRYPSKFLVIHDLARFRSLQTSEDDFGFSSFGDDSAATSPSRVLQSLLKDGAPLGMHIVCWCDSYKNLTRWFERSRLRDFGLRILFQMSAVDSSNLMDSAAASHLGAYRALLYDDTRGETEKFRPYQMPSSNWLGHFASSFQANVIDDDSEESPPSDVNSLV